MKQDVRTAEELQKNSCKTTQQHNEGTLWLQEDVRSFILEAFKVQIKWCLLSKLGSPFRRKFISCALDADGTKRGWIGYNSPCCDIMHQAHTKASRLELVDNMPRCLYRKIGLGILICENLQLNWTACAYNCSALFRKNIASIFLWRLNAMAPYFTVGIVLIVAIIIYLLHIFHWGVFNNPKPMT